MLAVKLFDLQLCACFRRAHGADRPPEYNIHPPAGWKINLLVDIQAGIICYTDYTERIGHKKLTIT
jgi:hypothetical protein